MCTHLLRATTDAGRLYSCYRRGWRCYIAYAYAASRIRMLWPRRRPLLSLPLPLDQRLGKAAWRLPGSPWTHGQLAQVATLRWS